MGSCLVSGGSAAIKGTPWHLVVCGLLHLVLPYYKKEKGKRKAVLTIELNEASFRIFQYLNLSQDGLILTTTCNIGATSLYMCQRCLFPPVQTFISTTGICRDVFLSKSDRITSGKTNFDWHDSDEIMIVTSITVRCRWLGYGDKRSPAALHEKVEESSTFCKWAFLNLPL